MFYQYLLIGIVFFVLVVLIFLKHENDTLQIENLRCEEAIKNLDILLEKKLSILNSLGKQIHKKSEIKLTSQLNKIKNKKLQIFELEKELYQVNKSLNEFLEENHYVAEESEESDLKKLKMNNLEIVAIKDYYNKNAEIFNKKISKFYYLLIKLTRNFHKKEVFESRKEVEFEILKEEA